MNCYLCDTKSQYCYPIHKGTRTDPDINIMACCNCGLIFADTLNLQYDFVDYQINLHRKYILLHNYYNLDLSYL